MWWVNNGKYFHSDPATLMSVFCGELKIGQTIDYPNRRAFYWQSACKAEVDFVFQNRDGSIPFYAVY